MAFQTSMLPNIAATTTDLWPSIANTLAVPWRSSSASRSSRKQQSDVRSQKTSDVEGETLQQARLTQLPDFFRQAGRLPATTFAAPQAMDIRTAVSSLSRPALLTANPILRRPFFQPQSQASPAWIRTFMRSTSQFVPSSRHMSTSRSLSPLPPFSGLHVGKQTRGFGTGSIPRSQLASLEQAANNNPGNANTQNAFYQLLLRANLPQIVVERYQTGRFATNAATDESYNKAVAVVTGTAGSSSAAANLASAQGQVTNQGFAQSVAVGSAAGGAPIPVIITEARSSIIFRWVKFTLVFALFTYLSLAALTVALETLVTYRKGGPGAKTETEVKAEKQTTKFSDVHGCDEAKEELQEVVEFLRNPEMFTDLGAKLPKGVLLVGPPGTGKTLLARAIAGEAGVPFFYMSGSEFDEIYVGVGAKRVRELFSAAKAKSPAIIFIDELDAVGGIRNPKDQAYTKQTLNQLLTELDGFNQETQIVVIGATNLPSSLDKALTRPGRFDRHVNVGLPDVRGRLAILKHHATKIKLAPDVDLESLAARAAGNSGAELENMLNVAALRASRARASVISAKDMDWAYDRIMMGSERKSMVLQEKEKEMTAYHEAGHALVQLLQKNSASKLYKVTILPKGPSLGHTAFVPQMDKYSYTAAEYSAQIQVALGGKMAEELQYGNDRVTTGVSADLESATNIAFDMVSRFGMSELLGPVEYYRRYENLSSQTRAMVEGEVQKMLKASYEDVRKLLTDNRKELDRLAKALVEYETLDKSEVEKVIRGEKLVNKPKLPPGPLTVPIPDSAPLPPGLTGVPVPQPAPSPPESTAPPAPTAPSGAQ